MVIVFIATEILPVNRENGKKKKKKKDGNNAGQRELPDAFTKSCLGNFQRLLPSHA